MSVDVEWPVTSLDDSHSGVSFLNDSVHDTLVHMKCNSQVSAAASPGHKV